MSTSETGHEKNLANFKTLISYLDTLPKYKPVNPALTSKSTLPQLKAAEELQDAIGSLQAEYNNKVKQQEILFKDLPTFTTRLVNSAKSFVTDPELAERVVSLGKQINGGGKAKPKSKPGETPADSISTSHQSYDNKVANFGDIIDALETVSYTANETEFEIANLKAYHAQLKEATEAVDTAAHPYKNGMSARNQALYGNNAGILDTVAAIKIYFRSVYNLRTSESKYIHTLVFRHSRK